MKAPITKILTTFILLSIASSTKSSNISAAEQVSSGPLSVILKASPTKFLTIGNIYTKAEVIALFGTPDKYNEWESDGGMGFECVYGKCSLFFDPERGFESFVFNSDDCLLLNPEIRLGEEYNHFIASHSFRIEPASATVTGIRRLKVWPEGYVDSYFDIYFKEIDSEYRIFRIVYSPPV